jgi:Clostridial hydrophobic W
MPRTPRQQAEHAPEPVAAVMTRPDSRPDAPRPNAPRPNAGPVALPDAGLIAPPDAARVAPPDARPVGPPDEGQGRVAELRVSGHLMTLDSGLFCVFQAPGSPSPDVATGLPGVRITLPPGASGRPDAISISTFREDGWLNGTAALVRVADGPAQILVTIYQSPRQGPETAPRLQVLRLNGGAVAPAAPQPGAPAVAAAPPQPEPEIVAHVQRTGDVRGLLSEWIGTRGSGSWIEGFAVKPREGVAAEDIEYQAVLGRGWLSPWVDGGKFCGSRGMALPLLGIKLRLKGAAAGQWECSYEATFTDGSKAGPVSADEACEAESLASLEAFRIELRRRDSPAAPEREPVAAAKQGRPVRSAARLVRPGGNR